MISGDVEFVNGIRVTVFVYGWIGLRGEISVLGLGNGLDRYIHLFDSSHKGYNNGNSTPNNHAELRPCRLDVLESANL